MLSPAEIESLSGEVKKLFDKTLDVWRGSVNADDAYGGRGGGTPVETYTGIPCEVYPGVAHVVDIPDFSQLVSNQGYTITVPLGTDIQKGDLVIVEDLRLMVRVVLKPESLELQMRFLTDKEALNEVS